MFRQENNKFLLNVLPIIPALFFLCAHSAQAEGAGVQQPAPGAQVVEINTLEKKLFSRVYEVDPLDKRLQRLELMLFGSTQDGNLGERMARIQRSAAEKQLNVTAAAASGHSADAKQLAQISVLEKKMLKKNFLSETAAQRLARLETKVLGAPANALTTNDRIDRLQKIAGVSDMPAISQNQTFGQSQTFGRNQTFGGNQNFGGSQMPAPFFSYNSPFGPSNADVMPHIDEMMKQFNKNMRGLHKLPDGAPNYGTPDGMPFIQRMPRNMRPNNNADTCLPPYLDPNSI